MRRLYLDLETFSEVPITSGTHVYAASAEVMLLAYAFDEEPVQVVDFTTSPPGLVPDEVDEALRYPNPDIEVVIHNSHFDLTVLRHVYGLNVPRARIHDTMVQALSHSLPGALGQLCEVLGLPADKAKDKDGKRLIQLFCKPLGKNRILRRATRETHPVEWERFKAYAASDIEAMREIMKRMPMLNMTPAEHALWELDQTINDRGIAIDMELVDAAIKAVDKAQRSLAGRTVDITDGKVLSTTQGEALRLHVFEAYGIDMPDLQMATVEKTLAMDIDPALRELLLVRLQASSTSTSKYKVFLRGTSADGRLRGTLQFDGASRTGRWAGRLVQLHNLPKPTLNQPIIASGIEALKVGCAHLTTDNVMELTSSCIRGCLVAPAGQKLIIADLANIEGRVQAWLSNEEWKLEAFRAFDRNEGPDLYKLSYSKAFGVKPEDVTKDQRTVGKIMELSLAYAAGVGSFVTFAAVYGIDLDDMADKVLPSAPEEIVAEADSFLEWCVREKRERYGLSDDAFVACEVLKRVWRRAHPNITGYWARLQSSILQALNTRGETYTTLGLKIRATKTWLLLTLPSGRTLCYPSPKIIDGAISYMGVHQFTRKWTRIHTHGGRVYENLCQAIARDVLAEGLMLAEKSGYKVVLHVHDEIIAEVPDSPEFNVEGLAAIMSAPPSWALDMPLAAAGFETYRYRKE